ncbi:MAG: protein kinase [Pyrinomonadaceae bacterium]|nr:protein kinase [Pyrinomonadaceae bacterium]
MLVGERLGRYEIERLIGSGGMGEVFLAKDSQLGRSVALKVLLPEFCLDEDRVKRFMYEARAVSALNHPGIITIHEIVDSDNKLFIATEHIDGETVRDKIENESLSLYQAVSISEQVADALSVAHQARIVHRDIKPENIMVRKDGIAKVLDFGLAKPLLATDEDEKLLVETQPGLVIGSVRYMSPEQARGKETDGRTDIWSLGVVLHEMITGETPFDGESVSDQLAALIHEEPQSLSEIPVPVDGIVRRSLNKDRNKRYDSVQDLAADLRKVRLELERDIDESQSPELAKTISLPKHNTSESATLIHQTISSDKTSSTPLEARTSTVETAKRTVSRFAPIAAALVVGFLAMAGWYSISAWFAGDNASYDTIQISRLTDDGDAQQAAVSPDGKFVAFASKSAEGTRMSVRQVATGSEVEIVPASDLRFLQPAFSHDGDFVYYVGVKNGVGTLWQVSALGGESRELIKDIDSRPALSPDGKRIAFFRHNPTKGGDKIILTSIDGTGEEVFGETEKLGVDKILDLFWGSKGKRIFATGARLTGQPSSKTELIAIDVESKDVVGDPAVEQFDKDRWSPAMGFQALSDGSGYIFVGRKSADEAMQVWHLDTANGETRSVTTDTSDYEAVSVSADGKTVIATKMEWTGGLHSFDPKTKETKQIKPDSNRIYGYNGITATPDDQIIYSARDGKEINLYVIDPTTGNERKLTTGSAYNLQPVSAGEKGDIVFASNRSGRIGIWKMDRDGKNAVQLTFPEKGADVSPVYSKTSREVIFVRKMNDGGLSKLMKVSIEGGAASELMPGSKTSDMMPRVSSTGNGFAYIAVHFDENEAKLTSKLRIGKFEEGEPVFDKEEVSEIVTGYGQAYNWAPDGKGFTRIKPEAISQLWSTSGGSEEQQLSEFTAGKIKSFVWSKDGKKIYVVKGDLRSDLVLIKAGEKS